LVLFEARFVCLYLFDKIPQAIQAGFSLTL
jgi:hypothetical protein